MKRIVRHIIRLYRCYRALMNGKKVYYVPDLNVMCFASSVEQCRGKFIKHRVVRPYKIMQVCFILFGYMSNDKADSSNKIGEPVYVIYHT